MATPASIPNVFSRAGAALAGLPGTTRGALWMLLTALLMAILGVMIRYLSSSLHPFELAFFRSAFGVLFILPWLAKSGMPSVRTPRFRLFLVRAVVGGIAMLSWFYGLTVMPLADAVALGFTAPLFATAGAALFLGEDVRARRWTATIVGFCGAMVILRPGAGTLTSGALIVLFSAAVLAATGLLVKELSRTEPVRLIVLYMVLFMTPVTFVASLFVWRWPSLTEMVWLVALAAVATCGNVANTRALAEADMSVVTSFDFIRLPLTALLAYFAFGEAPDRWTWIGAAVIAVSSLYIAHREAQLEKRRRAAVQTGPSASVLPRDG